MFSFSCEFISGEPNESPVHSCLAAQWNEANDVLQYYGQDCKQDYGCLLCMVPRVSRSILRGMETSLDLDSLYFNQIYRSSPSATKVYFPGFTNSEIVWDVPEKSISVYSRGQLVASIEAEYPLGAMKLKMLEEGFKSNNVRSVKLTRVCC